jgi:hypothetical protein
MILLADGAHIEKGVVGQVVDARDVQQFTDGVVGAVVRFTPIVMAAVSMTALAWALGVPAPPLLLLLS